MMAGKPVKSGTAARIGSGDWMGTFATVVDVKGRSVVIDLLGRKSISLSESDMRHLIRVLTEGLEEIQAGSSSLSENGACRVSRKPASNHEPSLRQ